MADSAMSKLVAYEAGGPAASQAVGDGSERGDCRNGWAFKM
jgi:hypothetical protein